MWFVPHHILPHCLYFKHFLDRLCRQYLLPSRVVFLVFLFGMSAFFRQKV